MKKSMISVLFIFVVAISFYGVSVSTAGGYGGYRQAPELDHALMGFKEQGVWYFPCAAPQYPVRFGPAYVTYGPPPPCAPPACAPVRPMKVK